MPHYSVKSKIKPALPARAIMCRQGSKSYFDDILGSELSNFVLCVGKVLQ